MSNRFKQKANSGTGRAFRKAYAEENTGEWQKNRAKEWIWVASNVISKRPRTPTPSTTSVKKSVGRNTPKVEETVSRNKRRIENNASDMGL